MTWYRLTETSRHIKPTIDLLSWVVVRLGDVPRARRLAVVHVEVPVPVVGPPVGVVTRTLQLLFVIHDT